MQKYVGDGWETWTWKSCDLDDSDGDDLESYDVFARESKGPSVGKIIAV